ncbi:DUF4825 domain-containing protein [Rossellomorea vietnamensis]|uniref:DUF4825 domain-containing protein n=1 Tax=Rossellomorea vietnamensis TaxID=218284 RepID=UPI0016538B52|nr:DUF4825 domain-containing protein [Rossellomorea vietnamensis]
MKRKSILFLSLTALLTLYGCTTTPPKDETIFQYKDSYVGDSGAVGNITRPLDEPAGEHMSGLELKTTEEPYGIILNYSPDDSIENNKLDYRELSLYNASIILALVKNAEWVQFNFVEEKVKVPRDKLEHWIGKDIRDFSEEEELRSFIQEHLEDAEKVDQFFRD